MKKETARKIQLKMKREFLNTLYFSSYTGAGALCSTSVDLVKLNLGGEFISEKKFSTRFTDFKKIEVFEQRSKQGRQAGAELGQAQPELGLENRVFMLWFEFRI